MPASRSLIFLAAMIAAINAPAFALPGQSQHRVCAWAKHTPKLSNVDCSAGSEGEPDYISARIRQPSWADGAAAGFGLTFAAVVDATQTVTREVVSYRHLRTSSGVSYEGPASNGVRLLRVFYGDGLANDVLGARVVAHVGKRRISLGKRFVYVVGTSMMHADTGAAAGVEDDFAVFPLHGSASAVAYARSVDATI